MSERSGVGERGRLYFCVGLAHSGKSTHCNEWCRKYHQPDGQDCFTVWTHTLQKPMTQSVELHSRPRVAVGGDDFRKAVYGQEYWPGGEGMVFAAMDVAIRALLSRGYDVIVDETCTTESTLLRYLKIDGEAIPVFIDTPAEECVRRAIKNGREYLVGPIERMDEQLRTLRANWDETVAKLRGYVEMRKGLDVAV